MGEERKRDFKGTPIQISAKAAAEIENIFRFIAIEQEKPLTARKVREKIFEKINKIGMAPYANKPWMRSYVRDRDIRQGVVLSWVIIYEILEDKIEIHKVVHRSKNDDLSLI